ncbi:hypothetical protein [Legionella quateirensis]|uniref:Transposase n=1 Tax=Legionella quateirensis TaxID=45072 RepID=A0A378L194_9GAMM|nr:hypothetical protein [Legionella quateirensis]KTD50884.1 hypothetical protein Lqua_1111 [Legionella quateirensis]STY17870.1 transposase [Legionella quateirensis]
MRLAVNTLGLSEAIFFLPPLLPLARAASNPVDVGGARFWRIDSKADYGVLNDSSNHKVNKASIRKH